MAVKQTGQPSFVEAFLPRGAGSNVALDRLAGLAKWYRFEKLLAHLRDEGGPGRPGYPVLVPRDCVGDRARGPHDASLFDIQAKYGDVITLDDALVYVAGTK